MRKKWTRKKSIAVAIVVHVVLLIAISFWVLKINRTDDVACSAAAGGTGKNPQTQPISVKETRQAIDAKMKDVADKSPGEQEEELNERLKDLAVMPKKNADEAATFVENVKGVDRSRAYEPRPGVKGRFDADSTVLYDIVKRTKKNGETVYVHIMVDRDGRSLEAEIPEKQMTSADLRSFRMFEMARRNPKLRRMIRAAIRISDTDEK
jgi:hypothetical protein